MKTIKTISLFILMFMLSILALTSISSKDIEVKAESEPILSIYKNNVSYSDKLNILYAVSYQNIDINTNKVQLLFFDNVQEQYIKGKESYVSYSEGTSTISGTKVLIYYSNGLAAKEMTEDIYAVAYVQIDGKDYYSEVNKFSVLEYALKIKETSSNTLQVELVLAMLKYGSLAQQVLNYNTNRLADATYYNINVVNGSLSDGFSQGRVKENEVITLTANNRPGYEFLLWIDQDSNFIGTTKNIEVTVTKSNKYQAIFKETDIERVVTIINDTDIETNQTYEILLDDNWGETDFKNAHWSVSDNSLAEISSDGILTTKNKKGNVIVSVTLSDGTSTSKTFTITSSYPDLQGYTIRIAQYEASLSNFDPFLEGYKAIDKLAKQQAWREIEELFNCKIEVVPYPSTAEWGPSRWNYIIDQSTIIGTSDFDFLTVPDSIIPLLADSGSLIDLTNLYYKYGDNLMSNVFIESGSYKNKLYSLTDAIPNIYNVMYYNIGLLETLQQYNEELQEPAQIFLDGDWTYSKFLEYCQEVQDTMAQAFGAVGTAGDYSQAYFAVSGWDSYWWVGLSSNDGEPLADTITGKINIDTPHKVQAAEVVKNLYTKKLAATPQSVDQNVTQWNEGKALFNTGDLWFVKNDSRWSSTLWGDDTRYGYVPWPRANDVKFDEIQVALGGVAQTWVMPIGRDYSQYGEECTTENIYWAICEMMNRTRDYITTEETESKLTNESEQYAHSAASQQAYIYIQELIKEGKGYFDPLVKEDNPIGSLYTNSSNRTTIKGAVTQYCATGAVGTWEEAIAALVPVLEESLNNSYIDVNYEIPYYTVNFITGTDVEIEPQVLKRLSIPQKPNITLEKEGYKFLGWGTNEYYVKEDVFEKVLTEDKTLYAVWEKLEYIEDPSNSAEELINSLYYEMKDNGTFDEIEYFPFGKTDRLDSEGNITNVMPLPKTIGEATTNLAGYEDIEISWIINEDGLFDENYKLLKQYLRYHEVILTYSIEYQGNTATLEKAINVGIAEVKNTIYLGGNWYQQSETGEVSGDVLSMLSKFDKPVGVLGTASKTWGYSYGYGQFQGTTWYMDVYELDAEGNKTEKFTRYQYFAHAAGFHTLDDMYKVELSDPNDKASAVITLNEELNKYIGTNYGGNWAAIYHNVTDHEVKIPLSPFSGQAFLGSEDVRWGNHPWKKSTVIDRDNAFGMDGWRVGFVCDAEGKVVIGSGDKQFQVNYDADGDGQLTEADYWVTIPAGGYAYTPRVQQNATATTTYFAKFCEAGVELNISYFDPYFLSPDGTSEGINSWKHE